MAKARGPYLSVTPAVVNDMEARRLRRRFGWAGFGLYLGLAAMCLGEADGAACVADDDGWAVLADLMGCGEADLRELVPYLAERGLADASALGDGYLRVPLTDESLRSYDRYRAAGSQGGRGRKKGSESDAKAML